MMDFLITEVELRIKMKITRYQDSPKNKTLFLMKDFVCLLEVKVIVMRVLMILYLTISSSRILFKSVDPLHMYA